MTPVLNTAMLAGAAFLRAVFHMAVMLALLFLLIMCGSAQKPSAQSPPDSIGAVIVPMSPDGVPNVAADIVLQTGHLGPVTAMAFSADGKILVSASEDGHVIVWNPQQGTEEVRLRGHAGPVRSMVLSGDDQVIASGADDGTINIWHPKQALPLRTLSVSGSRVLHLAISPDKRYLLSGDTTAPEPGAGVVRLWDLDSGRQLAVLEPESNGLTAVFFTAQGHAAIASVVGDMELHGTVKTFDVPSGRSVQTTQELVKAATPDGRWIAIQHGQWDSAKIGVRDALQGTEVALFSAGDGPVVFSANGEWVANIARPHSTAVVRRATTGETVASVHSENWQMERLAVSPDASLVATTGRGGGIQLWKTSDATLFQSMENRPGVVSPTFAWAGDSKTIVTAGT
jgi:WD40 repeat protein